MLVRKPDIPSVIAPRAEPVIALLALTTHPSAEVPSVVVETVRDEDAAAIMPVVAIEMTSILAPSVGVQAESAVVAKSELFTIMQTIPQVPLAGPMWSRAQSSSDFMVVSNERPPTGERRRAPATFMNNGWSAGLPTLFDI